MAYEPKPGQGTVFRNKGNGPVYKGYFVMPDGSIVGFALWEPKGDIDGYNLSIDDREGAYWAEKYGRPQTTGADDERRDNSRSARDDRRESRGRSDDRDDRRSSRDRSARGGDRDRYSTRDRDDDRRQSHDRYSDTDDRRGSRGRDARGFSDDLDDEIPF